MALTAYPWFHFVANVQEDKFDMDQLEKCQPFPSTSIYAPGVGCLGPAVESCSMIAICQEWSQWNTWTACSATCGEGERKRTRECIGGRDCPGVSMASRSPHVVHFLDLVVNPE